MRPRVFFAANTTPQYLTAAGCFGEPRQPALSVAVPCNLLSQQCVPIHVSERYIYAIAVFTAAAVTLYQTPQPWKLTSVSLPNLQDVQVLAPRQLIHRESFPRL